MPQWHADWYGWPITGLYVWVPKSLTKLLMQHRKSTRIQLWGCRSHRKISRDAAVILYIWMQQSQIYMDTVVTNKSWMQQPQNPSSQTDTDAAIKTSPGCSSPRQTCMDAAVKQIWWKWQSQTNHCWHGLVLFSLKIALGGQGDIDSSTATRVCSKSVFNVVVFTNAPNVLQTCVWVVPDLFLIQNYFFLGGEGAQN